jgi:hypothetical protein
MSIRAYTDYTLSLTYNGKSIKTQVSFCATRQNRLAEIEYLSRKIELATSSQLNLIADSLTDDETVTVLVQVCRDRKMMAQAECALVSDASVSRLNIVGTGYRIRGDILCRMSSWVISVPPVEGQK